MTHLVKEPIGVPPVIEYSDHAREKSYATFNKESSQDLEGSEN